ncbi:MAG: EAL domain-containing protein, partial [Oscillospiraceae bacterium]
SDELIASQEISNDMNEALKNGQFHVYLQPKFNLHTKEVSGAEALVRWNHPRKGLVPPDDFIPVFEKNGFIQKLDEYVWEKCCQYIRSWLDRGVVPYPISVNMSRVDTLNSQLCDILKEMLDKYNLLPEYLNIEITESAYMENSVQMIETITRLKNIGFKIEMDDFGKGYSSLNMISELPIDKLKLDMSFLQRKRSKMTSESVIKLIVDLAKTLNLTVVAEGIETKDDLLFLQEIGCEYGQGYYFSKPLPINEFEDLFLAKKLHINL